MRWLLESGQSKKYKKIKKIKRASGAHRPTKGALNDRKAPLVEAITGAAQTSGYA
jgi:hypothetical protein